MPGSKSIVTNTSPLIALAAGLGSLDILTQLNVTGSLGICLQAKKRGVDIDLNTIIENMQKHGIFISNKLIETVQKLATKK